MSGNHPGLQTAPAKPQGDTKMVAYNDIGLKGYQLKTGQ